MRESILLLFFLLLSFSSRVLGQAQDPRPFSGNAYPSSNAAGAGFWIGSKMDDVYAVQGIPEAVQRLDGGAEAWHYGRSTVTITGGRVSAYDNAGKNLRLMAIFPNNVPGGIFPGGGVRQVMPQANVSTPLQPDQKNIDFGPYMFDIQRHILRCWPHPKQPSRTQVAFKVHKDGRVSDLRIVTTSGLPEADNSALRAIEQSAPLRPPPGDSENVDVQMTFDSCVNVNPRR